MVYRKWVLLLFLPLIILLQPVASLAADKHVSDCLGDENCEENTDSSDEVDTEDSDTFIENQTMSTGSMALNIVKMVFALLLILAMIYVLLWFLKKRRSYDQVGALENLGGLSVGQQKSVQIVRIGDKIYLLGVGDNVELLKELTPEEAEQVRYDMEQSPKAPATSFLQGLFRKEKTADTKEESQDDFNASFQKELSKLKANRHEMMDYYGKKDDEHV